jgi:hypothetical protein
VDACLTPIKDGLVLHVSWPERFTLTSWAVPSTARSPGLRVCGGGAGGGGGGGGAEPDARAPYPRLEHQEPDSNAQFPYPGGKTSHFPTFISSLTKEVLTIEA